MASTRLTLKHILRTLTITLVLVVLSAAEDETPSLQGNSRESRQYLLRYPWPYVGRLHYDQGVDHQDYTSRLDEPIIESLSTDAVKWMRNLQRDEQERLTAWTLASAAVTRLAQQRNWASLLHDAPNSYQYNSHPFRYQLDYGQQRTPFYPSPIRPSPVGSEARTFFLIQQVIRRVATAIQQCQIGFFSPLIGRCRQPTTTTPRTTVVWKTTTTTPTTTTSTTPLTTSTTTTLTTTTPSTTTTPATTTSTTAVTTTAPDTPTTSTASTAPTITTTTIPTPTTTPVSTSPTLSATTTTEAPSTTPTDSTTSMSTTTHHPGSTTTLAPTTAPSQSPRIKRLMSLL